MANYSAWQSVHKTLVADTPDTVTLTNAAWIAVEVMNRHATAWLWFTVDGSTPAVEGDDTYPVPPMSSVVVGDVSVATATVVNVVSDGAAAYSVTGSGDR